MSSQKLSEKDFLVTDRQILERQQEVEKDKWKTEILKPLLVVEQSEQTILQS